MIGAGPTGAAAAWRLAAQGIGVVLIERGDWFDHQALDRDAPDWEITRTTRWSSNPNIRRAADDDPIDDTESPIKPMFASAIGGTSHYWTAHVPRFRPEDFRMHTLDGVGADWPVAYDDLAPYYALNEERWGVAAMPGDPASPPHAGRTLPTIGAHGRRFVQVFDRLGWHWWPVDLVVGREPGPACTHIGPCDLGCPARQRSSADLAYVRDALAAGVRLLARTRVLRLEHEGRITHALCADDQGRFRVHADRFVIAANGLGTPTLLLRSTSARFPNGLANSSGLVGRNLMLHPYARIDGWFDDQLGGWVSGQKAGLVSFEFYINKPERGFVRGLKLQLVTAPGPVALAEGAVIGAALPWGRDHHEAFEARFDRICGFTVCAEDLAEPENRIALSERLTDRDGLPAAKMIYRVSENSRRALDFGLDRADEVLKLAGAHQTFRTPLRDQAGFHLMGTTRMGTDPATSVVDQFGRAHDHPNLYVADASVFVTSAAINPTATAQALALRTADHIIATRRH